MHAHIFREGKSASNFAFSKSGTMLTFYGKRSCSNADENVIWYYHENDENAKTVVDRRNLNMGADFKLLPTTLNFSEDGKKFSLRFKKLKVELVKTYQRLVLTYGIIKMKFYNATKWISF